ncbi:MAG: C25 family cysteine peptidase [Flavobacteriales bacterium]|nr:C25 family cysteine peptidase [Flavobacteriales bacterium]
MKKFYFLIIISFLNVSRLFSQNIVYAGFADEASNLKVTSSSEDETIIQFTLGTLWGKQFLDEWVFSLDAGSPIQEKGYPDLPKINGSIIIPDFNATAVEIISANYWDISNVKVAPSKGVLSRAINPDLIYREKGPIYLENEFYPSSVVSLSSPYILRDFRAQVVSVFPVQYNPVSKNLRIYYSIEIKVKKQNELGINPLIRTNNLNYIDKEFNEIYKKLFLNYSFVQRSTPVDESGRMLIITHPDFENEIKPFAEWKIQRGLPVEIVTTNTTGTTSVDIKQFIEFYYSMNQDLKYILLVGDAMQIPPQLPDVTNQLAGPSDNFYGYLVGNDRYPDVFVGRFSSESLSDVRTQVERSLAYEKNPGTSDIFSKGITIASNEGPGDDGEMDFEHARNLRTQLLNFTYTHVDEMYDGTQGGIDLPDNPTPQMVVDALNEGRGLITYTGHGWDQGCASSGFSTAEIPLLTNHGKLPFFWSVACVNGDFIANTCFAEALLRAKDPANRPTGAVATLMSTINQYWNEPMEGQDEMVSILTESHINNVKRTFGGISMNGCIQMNNAYGWSGMDMTDTWTCFGDPSLLVRTDQPQPMIVGHITTSPTGISSLNVSCNMEDALISLTVGNQIIGKGNISAGQVNITFNPILQTDTILVTATAFNRIPYQGWVIINDIYAGINDLNEEHSAVNLYPNPANDFVNISGNELSWDIQAYDVTGKIIFNQNNFSSKQLNIESWASGVYTLVLKSSESKYLFKLIKQ